MVATLRWTDWSWDPPIVAGLLVLGLAYRWLLRRAPARGRQPLCFWTGYAALVLALLSPVDAGAAYLFTLHMFQHMLLMIVAPPLLALGVPATALGWVYRRPVLRRAYQILWSPVVATSVYNGVLLLWHLPAAYDATLRDPLVHAVEHASFGLSGLLFWGVIVSPSPRLHAALGVRLVMLLASDVVNFILGFALAFAGHPLYAPYAAVPRLWGLGALEDLRLGGALMWVMGQMMYAIPLLVLLSRFLWRRGDRDEPAAPSAAA